jgi:hypothetical protein
VDKAIVFKSKLEMDLPAIDVSGGRLWMRFLAKRWGRNFEAEKCGAER